LSSAASSVLTHALGAATRSEDSSTSNQTFGQTSTIDDIFKDLTYTARTMDLSRQNPRKSGPAWWLMAGIGFIAAAAVAALVFILLK